MKKPKEVFVDGEIVYLKKDWLGYRVVEPMKDPNTNKVIWKNMFSKKGFVTLFFLLLILFFGYMGFREQINNFREVMKNPCVHCKDCQQQTKDFINKYNQFKINFSDIESDGKG